MIGLEGRASTWPPLDHISSTTDICPPNSLRPLGNFNSTHVRLDDRQGPNSMQEGVQDKLVDIHKKVMCHLDFSAVP